MPRIRLRHVAGLVALAVALVIALPANAHRTAVRHSVMTPAVGVHPNYVMAGHLATHQPAGTVLFSCQANDAFPVCYGPDQIRTAYRVKQLINGGTNGKGQTIVIIDAFGSPTITQDLQTFDGAWGLPDPVFNVIAPFGVGTTDPNNAFGWALETSLDVEWAHVIAPKAKIDLIVAKTNNDADILKATKYAVDHNLGDVISQSFGEGESCMDPDLLSKQHDIFEKATNKDITLFASSGDSGAGATCDGLSFFKGVSTPASDPNVTSVGGTNLTADAVSGKYGSETTWDESAIFGQPAAGGGGFSELFKRPNYQDGFVNSGKRGLPDIAYNAGINGGVLVFITDPTDPAFVDVFIVGGTSAGSPQWAGLTTLIDQLNGGRVGKLNPALYSLAGKKSYSSFFHDITTGQNGLPDLTPDFPGTPVKGFNATKGWDAATGLGTPIADTLVPAIAGH